MTRLRPGQGVQSCQITAADGYTRAAAFNSLRTLQIVTSYIPLFSNTQLNNTGHRIP